MGRKPHSEAYKIIQYRIKKAWFKAVFKEWEWVELSGREILKEARLLKYKITKPQFYQIRREIMKDLGLDPGEPDSFEVEHIRRFSKLPKD